MNFETGSSELEGKVVGRVGVEPTTKRLRESFPTQQSPEKLAESPLIVELGSVSKRPAFRPTLRGAARFLIGLALLSGVLAVSAWTIANDPSPRQIDYCPPHDSGNPWCLK